MATFRGADIVGVGMAAFLTGVGITFVIANQPIPEPAPVEVVVAPTACTRALDAINDYLMATADVVDATNEVGPLVADAYAAGLAGNDPMIDRVTKLNKQIKEATQDAEGVSDRYVKLAARCRALTEAPG